MRFTITKFSTLLNWQVFFLRKFTGVCQIKRSFTAVEGILNNIFGKIKNFSLMQPLQAFRQLNILCKIIYTFNPGNILAFGILLSVVFNTHIDFDKSMYFGYAMMLLAISLIFAGVKNYRDKYNGGTVSFGKAFRIGLYITLIASTMYVVNWLIDYYYFVPDFADKYAAHMLDKLKAGGASAAEMTKQAAEMESFKTMYKNPFFNMLITYTEVLPVGLLLSLISAFVLRKKVAAVTQQA